MPFPITKPPRLWNPSANYGWRTNFNQRVYQWTEDSNYYVWEDADGTKHYFAENADGELVDEDGLELTLTLNSDGTFTIADKYGNESIFNAKGRLSEQKNNQKNRDFSSIVITYTATNDTLIYETSGKVVLGICGVVILVTAMFMLKFTKPIEYKR